MIVTKISTVSFINQNLLKNSHNQNSILYQKYNRRPSNDKVSFQSNTNNRASYLEKMNQEMNERLENHTKTGFHSTDAYMEALDSFNISKYIRLGGDSFVAELSDGNILKLSCEKYPLYMAKYHAPEVHRDVIQLSQQHKAMNSSMEEFYTDKAYYVIQKKGLPATDIEPILELCEMAKKDNLYVFDPDVVSSNFAYFDTPNGNVVKCIDLNCIANHDYPVSKAFEAIERMEPNSKVQTCMLFSTLQEYFKNIFENEGVKINNFINFIKPKLIAGENIFDVMNEILPTIETKVPGIQYIEHIKFK